jgi:hypothetical protein
MVYGAGCVSVCDEEVEESAPPELRTTKSKGHDAAVDPPANIANS